MPHGHVDDMTLRPATAGDFAAIADFIATMNARPDQRCLHCDNNVDLVMKGLGELGLPPERSIVLAVTGGRITGLVGADLAIDQGRGWLWGPYAEHDDPLPICDVLMESFLKGLPGEIHVLDTFLDTRNVFLDHLARKHGFESPRTVHLYHAGRPPSGYPPAPPPSRLKPDQVADLTALHEAAFPNTWRNATEMLEDRDGSKALFVHEEAGRLEGYVYLEDDPVERRGHVHYLAVVPGARGRGIGRKLLQQGLDWCFNERGLPAVHLTVFDTLVNARALYESSGFVLVESGTTQRRTLLER